MVQRAATILLALAFALALVPCVCVGMTHTGDHASHCPAPSSEYSVRSAASSCECPCMSARGEDSTALRPDSLAPAAASSTGPSFMVRPALRSSNHFVPPLLMAAAPRVPPAVRRI